MDGKDDSLSKISFTQNALTEKEKARYAKKNSPQKNPESQKKAGSILSKFTRALEGIHAIENELLRLKKHLFSDSAEKNREKIMELELEILNKISNSYIIFRELCDAVDEKIMADFEPISEEISRIRFVKGVFLDNMIIIKTPRLLSKNLSVSKLNPSHTYYKKRDIFCQEVRTYLTNNEEKIPDFRKKNIAIFSVYPLNSVTIMDNDNLDFKEIVDVIASFSGGDSGERCSFFLSTICDSTIEEGTYFVVSDNFSQPIHQETVRKMLQKYFSSLRFSIDFEGRKV